MKRPNIVFIISDDHGNWALGSAGNKEVITPNLDRIAAEGIRFENFFCASPVCSPARVSIYTGKMPSQHGVHDWLAGGYIDAERDLDPELASKYEENNLSWEYMWGKSQLRNDKEIKFLDGQTTYSELLAANGYVCGLSGKWHMGGSNTPQAGYTYWETIAMGGDNYMYPTVRENGKMKMARGEYITDRITDKALSFLDTADIDKPFCLSVHYTAPHSPWTPEHHPAEIYDLYKDCKFDSVPNEEPHKWDKHTYKDREDFEKARITNLRGYYTAITAMDSGIGKIIDKLENRGLREDTMIIFAGDNGMCMGHHGLFGKGNATWPMNMFEESVKVPFIISYPAGIKGGRTAKGMYSHYDIIKTLDDYLSLTGNEGQPAVLPDDLPGKSFAPVLASGEETGASEIVVCDEYGPVRMYRTEQYKYVERYGAVAGINEFYDLVSDPFEKNNLIDKTEYRQLIKDYSRRLNKWFEKHCDPRYDGRYAATMGIGQTDRIWPRGEKEPFIQAEKIYKDPAKL